MATAAALTLAPMGLASAAQPLQATQPEAAPHITVHYRDLDISGRAGASTLLRRIEVAAHLVCGDLDGPRPLSETTRARQCYTQAVAEAVRDVHAAAVTAEYVANFGTSARSAEPHS